MSTWLIIAVTVAYVGVALEQGWRGNWSTAVIFVGYSLANLGFIAGMLK